MLKVKQLKYKFDKTTFEFNFDLTDNNIVGVIGKSGSGKSTLFNLLAGFLKPNNGSIFLNENNITYLKPPERNISILFQDHNNFDHLTIFENIILGIDPDMKQNQNNFKIVKNIMKKVSLNIDLNKKVSDLSGGEQQRVSIARSLLRKKSLFLLDEPFNSLDPGLRKTLYEDVKKMSLNNRLITLISSHLIDELKNVTDKFLFINKGKIVENKILSYKQLLKNKYFKEYLQ
jgi:thiamine transport system ATP-binding protein|tara:strand:+ start:203 stop:895 length:693 start_codon:yes stop_codon:yes gene_type:complete